jgi:uncharacterized protein (TIGR02466 family)
VGTLRQAKLEYPFVVPVLRHRWDDAAPLNAALREAILAQAGRSAGNAKSNVGGWQSTQDFLKWTGEAGRALAGRMVELVNHATAQLLDQLGSEAARGAQFSWKLAIWANVNRRGDYNKVHLHPGATWSGVYYVDAGDPPSEGTRDAGRLSLMDASPTAQMTFLAGLVRPTLEVAPADGLMVLFPSYLPHMVHPYAGERPRISIAFNAHRDPYP